MFKTIIQAISKFRHGKRNYCYYCCPNEPSDPCTQMAIMHNGVRVATEEAESPLACVSLFIEAGARYETACTNGLTHFIEHFAFKGFKTMDRYRFEDLVACLGAKCMAYTSREFQAFSMVLPSEHATAAVDTLSRILNELNLNDVEVQRERYNIETELYDTDNNPKKVIFDYLHATAFQGTPLSQRVIGTSENLARFDANTAMNFMCEHYQPYRLVLATSGRVSHCQIMSAAESRFGCIAPLPGCEPAPGPTRFTGSQVLYRDDSMPLAHVAIAFEAPGYCDPSCLIMLLLKNIVGSWDRSQFKSIDSEASYAARMLANDNLCEKFESFYIVYRDIGLWGAYFVADRWKLDEVVFYIQQQWIQLCTMLTQHEVNRGLNATRLEMARRYDSTVNSAFDVGTQMLYTCGRRSLAQIFGGYTDMKVQTISDVAEKYLYDRCPAIAAMGPTETLPDYVRIRSGQWWLRV